MKNATKLVWLLMLFASSIVFAFGQTDANQMNTEQKIAYDNSIVSEGTVVENSVATIVNRNSKAILLDEDFGSGIPGSWTQAVYSGTGIWQWSGDIGPSYGQPSNTDGNYATADSDANSSWVYDVGLFTPSMDMTDGVVVLIDVDRNFQDLGGNDIAAIRTYSGGTAPGNLEEVLWIQTGIDDPLAGIHVQYMINATVYADPTDVYIEFYYSTAGGTYQWNFAIDNVYVDLVLAPGEVWGYVFNGGGLTIAGASVGVEAEGLLTTTDNAGWYSLPAVSGGPAEVFAWKQGYNVSIENPFVPPMGSVQQDFVLLAPTMIISPTSHYEVLNPDEYYTTQTGVLNTGDGNLHWLANIDYLTDGVSTTVNIPSFTGQIKYGTDPVSMGPAPEMTPTPSNEEPIVIQTDLLGANMAYIGAPSDNNLYRMDIAAGYATALIGGTCPSPASGDFMNGDFETIYVAGDWGANLYEVDALTGSATMIGGFSGGPDDCSGVATDRTSGDVYVCGTNVSTSYIGKLDVATGAISDVFATPGIPGLIDIAIDGSGQMYGWCIVNDEAYLIDKTSGAVTTLGSLGFDANYGQGGNWNPNDGLIYLAAYNNGGVGAELRVMDPLTGATSPVAGASMPSSQCALFAVPGSGGGASGDWLSLDYYENDVPPMGGLDNVNTNFNAAGMVAGEVHTATITFTSDPDIGTTVIPVTLIIAGDPLVAPTDLTVELLNDLTGLVELNWLWTTDAFQFFIIKRDGAPVATTTVTTYQENLPDYGTYCYTVQSFYDEGTSVPSEEVCVEWPLPEIFVNPTYHAAEVWVDHQYVWTSNINNIGIGTLSYDIPPFNTCEHEIVMYDDFGDGWNGGSVDIYVDGDLAINASLASGSGPGYDYFDATDGGLITTTWNAGGWPYEASYYIYDGFGNLVFSDGVGGVDPTGGSGFGACAGFIVDIDPINGFVGEGATQELDITWDATGYPAGVYYQEFTIEHNDPVNPPVVIGNEMTVVVPAEFAGTVTECEGGQPIAGVTVTAGVWQTLTATDGTYSLFVEDGTYTVYFEMLGYNDEMVVDTTALSGDVTPIDICLYEDPYPVPFVTATVEYPDEDFCTVEWSLPEGPYELIYDDGVAEDLFVWSTYGNENAVKFTPAGYPANVFGGRLYVGDGLFPAGNWLGTDFAIIVYGDDGAGLPGAVLDSIGVTVNNYGWVEFMGLDATIESGDFFISMLQLYPAPDAAPLGIDFTMPQVYRSYSRMAQSPMWSTSVYQDFMIRAYVNGSQTDGLTDGSELVRPPKVDREAASKHFMTANNSAFVTRPGTVKAGTTGNIEGYAQNSEDVLYYTVARMSDFDPVVGPASGTMTILNNVTEFTYVDNDFSALTMGWYAYAVQVAYSSGMMSPWTFSNIVGRDMDAAVTFEVTLCDGNSPEDVEISMQGTDYPFTLYFGVTDATGIYTFDQVWKGKYAIDVYKIAYEGFNWDQIISEDITIPVVLSEKRYAPRNLWVDPMTSYAYWEPPLVVALEEDFEGFDFPPAGWQATSNSVGWFRTMNGSSSAWTIPSWDSFYAVSNDDGAGSTADGSVDYLITPPLDLREVDTYRLTFDSYYDAAYGTQVATVEYSYDAGANWDVFYGLTPQAGAWAAIDQDLASFSGMTATAPIWFAFHSDDGGAWSSGWAVDNILFANGETDPIQYHVYLDGAFVAVTDTTYYQYSNLQYGTTYTSCVAAEYSCGLSPETCYTFTSIFLLPPRNLDGLTFDNTVHVWWEPPMTPVTDGTDSSPVFDPNFVPVSDDAAHGGPGVTTGPITVAPSSRALLYSNGPMYNSEGTGAGGANESIMEAVHTTYGWGCQLSAGNSMADNFEVTANWTIDEIVVYGYQTGAPTTSSITGGYIRVWDGDPMAGGAIIYGDLTTNLMTSTTWTNIYRNNDGPGGSTNRAIMEVVCATPGLSLTPGMYWVEYTLDGSTSFSGPWSPYVVVAGQNSGNGDNNGLQNIAGTWGVLADGGFGQDLGFEIIGSGGGGGGGGEIPDNFIGYNLYRDFDNIAYIPYNGEDTTHYFDYELEPLCYEYDVTAVYDLTPYGFPGETAESMYEGPFDVCVEYGWPLTFIEDWNTGSFDPNLWTSGDNWVINGQFGNPYPCAEFKWDPVLNDYRSALESYPIDGKNHPITGDDYIDGRIWFDFDIALEDNGMSGDEMLHVQIWDEGTWYTVASFDNADGSFDWTTNHFEISNHAFGKIFKVRFAAEGVNSSGILSWFVDNIVIYRQCDAPEDLVASADGYGESEIYLEWAAPAGGGGTPGGGEWIMWDDGVNVDGIGLTGGGVFSVASKWDADMITQYDGQYITKIRFVPYANVVATTFTLKVWEGANAGTMIYEQALSSVLAGEWNEVVLTTPVAIDVSQELWFGYTVDSPDGENPAGFDDGPAVAGYGDMISLDGAAWDPIGALGPFDLNWNLQAYVGDADGDNITPMTYVDNTDYRTPNATPVAGGIVAGVVVPEDHSTRALLGYNVYWDDASGTYAFLDFTEDTFYLHTNDNPFEVGSLQCYYVTAVFEDCEPESNEACWLVTGIEDNELADGVSVYPNPARDILNITSTTDITHVTVMNYVGQIVFNQKVVEDNDLQLSVAGYETGVYMVKVETTAGILIKKVTIAN